MNKGNGGAIVGLISQSVSSWALRLRGRSLLVQPGRRSDAWYRYVPSGWSGRHGSTSNGQRTAAATTRRIAGTRTGAFQSRIDNLRHPTHRIAVRYRLWGHASGAPEPHTTGISQATPNR